MIYLPFPLTYVIFFLFIIHRQLSRAFIVNNYHTFFSLVTPGDMQMTECYAIVNLPIMTLYTELSEDTPISYEEIINEKSFLPVDEELFGNVVRVIEEKQNIAKVITSSGFFGWVNKTALLYINECKAFTLTDIDEYFDKKLLYINAPHADILTSPDVMSFKIITLVSGSLVIDVSESDKNDSGYTRVQLPDGRIGYIKTVFTEKPKYGYGYLKADVNTLLDAFNLHDKTQQGGTPDFQLSKVLDRFYDGSEEAFRKALTDNALEFLNVQYRWAGRSSEGIDCSGLIQRAYLRAGVHINRNSLIKDGFPIMRLSEITSGQDIVSCARRGDILTGDILYFAGHVAMYLEDGLFIHATAHKDSGNVTINSLFEENPLYRADLIDILYAYGGIKK